MSYVQNIPIEQTRSVQTCSDCGQTKQIDEFNLKRGKHSDDRKEFCKDCEKIRRKVKRGASLTAPEVKRYLRLECSICGQEKIEKIDAAHDMPVGVLCRRCNQAVSFYGKDDKIEALVTYLKMRDEMPGILKSLLVIRGYDKPVPLFENQ